ncbi:MAG: NADH-quinone oxidoreductase subunit L [Bacteroidota bacterium]|nr:NADH-quinone oxidoreductase subunit L [Bacteroidota bacterium]
MEAPDHILVFLAFLAPLLSFITVCLVARAYRRIISILALFCMFVGFLSAAILLANYWNESPRVIPLRWFMVGNNSFGADLALSNTSMLMLAVVSLISLLVHLYSTVYMKGDDGWKKYFAMLGFFTFSMQGIVLSDNLLFLFIFWELVGFSSYMLIGHWTQKPEAGRAASKAFIMNRIGDAGFLVGLMIVWTTYNNFGLTAILQTAGNTPWQTAASLCIFCGIIGKSAQFPLFTWLPDAMEGPTPVSALIHAATMVAAGVYLLVRVFGLFTADALVVVAIAGMITTLVGALAALSQQDIKKILAYSTLSQLGLMIVALGTGAVNAAFLHLLTHAFFKACLFLAAGMVIHALHDAQGKEEHFDVQDIRNMGGLRKAMPFTFLAFLLSGASLAGVPFFSGFLSKEAIITALFMHTNVPSWLMIAVIMSVSFLTVLYTFRLIWFVFMGEERTIRTLSISEPGWVMRLPVALLALCSLWFLVSWNPFDFQSWIFPPGPQSAYSLWITMFSILWVMVALALGWYSFRRGGARTNSLFRNAFFVDALYKRITIKGVALTSEFVTFTERKIIDRGLHALAYFQVIFAHVTGWIDRAFVDGAVNATARMTGLGGKVSRSFQGGNIQLYIFWSVFAIIIFIIWAA